MKNTLFLLSIFIITSCQDAPTDISDIRMNKPFEIKIGEVVTIMPYNIQVGFDSVLPDSRCPINVICCWEGEAKIRIRLMKSRGNIIYGEVLISGYVTIRDTCYHKYIDMDGYIITLMQLDPYPIHPYPNDYTKYKATLSVNRLM